MKAEDRYKNFLIEYERLCDKYDMCFEILDKWEPGNESLEVYDDKEKVFIFE